MIYEFPFYRYEIESEDPDEHVWRPVIPIKIYKNNDTKGEYQVIYGLVDSGADESFMGPLQARYMGIAITKGKLQNCEGINGYNGCFLHTDIPIEILDDDSSFPMKIDANFSTKWDRGFVLLGRDGLFNRFLVTIDEPSRITRLEPH